MRQSTGLQKEKKQEFLFANTLPLKPRLQAIFALLLFQIGPQLFDQGQPWTRILLNTPLCLKTSRYYRDA
jgi:hypothetical protein